MNINNADHDDYLGIHIPDAFFPDKDYERDSNRAPILPPPWQDDGAFWSNLLNRLNDAPETERMPVLIAVIKEKRIARTPKHTSDPGTINALKPILEPLLETLNSEPEHLQDLTEEERGLIMQIKYKLGFQNPDDYELSRHGVLNPYEEQVIVDNSKKFVQEIERQIRERNPLMQLLTPGNDLEALPDTQKEIFAETLFRTCCSAQDIPVVPIVKYNPSLTRPAQVTRLQNGEYFAAVGPELFSKGPLALINTVAHEVQHIRQIKNRLSVKSKQTPRGFYTEAENKSPGWSTTKDKKYRANILAIRDKSSNYYDLLYGRRREYESYVAGMAATIFASQSPEINPKQEGILCKIDPTRSGGNLLIKVAKRIEAEIGVTLRQIVTRPYLVKPLEGATTTVPFVPLDVNQALAALQRWRKIYDSPMNGGISLGHAWLACMPEIMRHAHTATDPMQWQCAEIVKAILMVGETAIDGRAWDTKKLIEVFETVAKSFPDDLTRKIATDNMWTQLEKNRPDLSSVFPREKMTEVINAVERKFPLPHQFGPDSVAAHAELEMGVSMAELSAHFGISGKPKTSAKKALNALWALEKLPSYPHPSDIQVPGATVTTTALLNRLPASFHELIADTVHPLRSSAMLLRGIIRVGIHGSTNNQRSSIKDAVKKMFEDRFNFQFAKKPNEFDDNQQKKIQEIAKAFPYEICHELTDHIAVDAMSLTPKSPEEAQYKQQLQLARGHDYPAQQIGSSDISPPSVSGAEGSAGKRRLSDETPSLTSSQIGVLDRELGKDNWEIVHNRYITANTPVIAVDNPREGDITSLRSACFVVYRGKNKSKVDVKKGSQIPDSVKTAIVLKRPIPAFNEIASERSPSRARR